MKIKKSISLSHDTADRLSRHAEARHTSVSQLITDWVWQESLPEDSRTERVPTRICSSKREKGEMA